MQNDMQVFTHIPLPSGNSISLTMKVAVATGSARRFVVGNPAIQLLDVMAGATLSRIAIAEHLAQPGEVIGDQPTAAALDGKAKVREWRADQITNERFVVIDGLGIVVQFDNGEPTVPSALTEDQLRPWLLPGVFDRLCSGQGEFLTELRLGVACSFRRAYSSRRRCPSRRQRRVGIRDSPAGTLLYSPAADWNHERWYARWCLWRPDAPHL
jgi:hypothetical protein